MQELLDFCLHGIRSLLGPNLADAIVLARSSNRLPSFPLAMRQGLFNIDIFPGLHCPYRGQAVPVVAGGYDNHIDGI